MDELDRELQLLETRFPGFACAVLWVPNVFRGDMLRDFAKPHSNTMSADLCTRLLKLRELGVIESRNFNPSPPVRAFIGLRGTRAITEPTIETAHGYDWEVVDNSIGRRLQSLKNPATRLGEVF